MGKIDSGILSGFRGKVGTVVGYFRGEQCIIRVHKKTINASKSLASLTNQSKFSLALRLVKLLTEPFRRGYSGTAVPSLWFSKALGAIVKNATEGSYPAVSINYAKLPFSDGPGTTLVAFTGSVAANTRQLTLNWDSEDAYVDNWIEFIPPDAVMIKPSKHNNVRIIRDAEVYNYARNNIVRINEITHRMSRHTLKMIAHSYFKEARPAFRVNSIASYIFRYLYVKKLLDDGYSATAIQENLGHASLSTTLKYIVVAEALP